MLLGAACRDAGEATRPTNPALGTSAVAPHEADEPPPVADADPFTACERDDDCVIRYVGCCAQVGPDHDRVMSFSRSRQDAAVKHYGEPCDLAPPTCPLAAVGRCRDADLMPICVAGTCARRIAAGACGNATELTILNSPPPFSRVYRELWD